jgi:serine/threonine-protein kinase
MSSSEPAGPPSAGTPARAPTPVDLNPEQPPQAAAGGDSSAPDSTPDTSQPQAATIGHIGRYALKQRLGEGGLGTVYAAYDPIRRCPRPC